MDERFTILIKMFSTAFGAVTGYFFGGWGVLMHLLLILVAVDWFTGWIAAWSSGELMSRRGFYGIARKVAIFLMVTVAHFVDLVLGNLKYFQNAVIFFYLANELLSIIENAGRMGLPIPKVFQQAIEILNSKSDEEEPSRHEQK
ncbi:phage holin family protein [Paenibacillus dokdonensis]|uniref:Phage holin family protein n=1 Tax=Paenibacillus dokdonensis TaxID=2567944 RepID=A0ABU6GIJ4_9BACL|nr:phage holin family protein [Paenibacillus dokdonensis]MEC0239248.1 phage holin family protein [Paenibacillus dokdonensis]